MTTWTKLPQESIFGTYFSVKHLNFLSRSSCSSSSSLGFNFLSFAYFSQTFNHVCVDLVVFLFFPFSFSWSTTISSDKANRLFAILLFMFKFRASTIVSIVTFVWHFTDLHLHSIIYFYLKLSCLWLIGKYMYTCLCIHRKCIPIEGCLAQGHTSFMRRDNTLVVG